MEKRRVVLLPAKDCRSLTLMLSRSSNTPSITALKVVVYDFPHCDSQQTYAHSKQRRIPMAFHATMSSASRSRRHRLYAFFCQNLASHVPWRVNDVYKQHTIVVILQSSCDRFSAYLGIIIGDVEGIMLLVGQTRASIFLDVRNLCPPFSSVLR